MQAHRGQKTEDVGWNKNGTCHTVQVCL